MRINIAFTSRNWRQEYEDPKRADGVPTKECRAGIVWYFPRNCEILWNLLHTRARSVASIYNLKAWRCRRLCLFISLTYTYGAKIRSTPTSRNFTIIVVICRTSLSCDFHVLQKHVFWKYCYSSWVWRETITTHLVILNGVTMWWHLKKGFRNFSQRCFIVKAVLQVHSKEDKRALSVFFASTWFVIGAPIWL